MNVVWNYRLVRLDGGQVGVYEVYYDWDSMTPISRLEDPSEVVGDDADDVRVTHLQMLEAFEQSVLEDSIFESKEAKAGWRAAMGERE